MNKPKAKNGGNVPSMGCLRELAKFAHEFKVQILKTGTIEIIFHPSAFVQFPKEMIVQPKANEKQKTSQEKEAENEELLYYSS